MGTIHIREQLYDGYSVGTGVEFPGIIVSADTREGLVGEFRRALPAHKRALERYKIDAGDVTVIAVDE